MGTGVAGLLPGGQNGYKRPDRNLKAPPPDRDVPAMEGLNANQVVSS
jgi:hypothetical protein